MCTLTVIATPDQRVRLAFNRDESPDRAAGLPPIQRRFGEREALLPIDPNSGGTWLAVNDAGLALALLNVYASVRRANSPGRSRGEIIPRLLECASPAEALAVAERQLNPHDFAPFQIVLVGGGEAASLKWDGVTSAVALRQHGATPLMFTSSGLGDDLVEGPRRELFVQLLSGQCERSAEVQDAFHAHRWPGREHLSVNMRRSTACTVSFASIELDREAATLTYHPAAPDQPAERTTLRLPLAAGASPSIGK